MAVLDKVPKLQVTICVDGEPLREYDDDEQVVPEKPGPVGDYQTSRTVSKYIEVVSDKDFTINLALDKGFKLDCYQLSCQIWIDGKWVVCPHIPYPILKKDHGERIQAAYLRVIEGSYIAAPGQPDQQLIKPFKFCKIETTMDDDKLENVKKDLQAMAQIGEFVIKVHRIDHGTPCVAKVADELASSVSNLVHEKALKGETKSHSVSYGTASKLVKRDYYDSKKLDGIDYPIAIFKFKYRSREALKSLLIIPRTPSPEPRDEGRSESPPPLDLNSLDETQKKQVARFLQDLNRGRSSSGTPQATIKRERIDGDGESAKKRKKSGKSEIIDLTEDSDGENIVPPK